MSISAKACFVQPEGLVEEHYRQFYLLGSLGIIMLALAVMVRFYSDRSRVWVPILTIATFGYLPMFIFLNSAYGFVGVGGLCGVPEAVIAGKIILAGGIALFSYELIYLKRLRNENKI